MLGFFSHPIRSTEIFAQLRNQRIEGIPVKKIANNKFFKVTPSYFVRVPSYFEALWYPQLYFDRKSNI